MRVLITGAGGFIGRNLAAHLQYATDYTLFLYDVDTEPGMLTEWCAQADAVVHLAGINRPDNPDDFLRGNRDFTAVLLDELKAQENRCPVLMSSSIQAALDNPYGNSKRAGEELLQQYSAETGAPVYVYRLPNVFGKWCRPGYNSAIATFCHNIAHGLPITVNDPAVMLTLVYIDDVMAELVRALEGTPTWDTTASGFCRVPIVHTVTLGRIVQLLEEFRDIGRTLAVPDVGDDFVKALYATYLSYLPEDGFTYPLTTHADERGSFTEILRTADRGQMSVNISRPGITKGNHWHHTKHEKFLVVSGCGVVRFRRLGSDEVLEYPVSGESLQVVDIPPGYTHSIVNTGDVDMVTLMWCNECFDPTRPDTYFLEV